MLSKNVCRKCIDRHRGWCFADSCQFAYGHVVCPESVVGDWDYRSYSTKELPAHCKYETEHIVNAK